jgi:hypothetical protein
MKKNIIALVNLFIGMTSFAQNRENTISVSGNHV